MATRRQALDYIDIQQILARYCRAIDRMDAVLLESVYWDDAIDDHVIFSGSPKEFSSWVFEHLSREKIHAHLLGQSLIDINGDEATGETYFFAQHLRVVDGKEYIASSSGRYVDRFQKRRGEWRILRRSLVMDMRRLQDFDAAPAFPASVSAKFYGTRDTTDFSYSIVGEGWRRSLTTPGGEGSPERVGDHD